MSLADVSVPGLAHPFSTQHECVGPAGSRGPTRVAVGLIPVPFASGRAGIYMEPPATYPDGQKNPSTLVIESVGWEAQEQADPSGEPAGRVPSSPWDDPAQVEQRAPGSHEPETEPAVANKGPEARERALARQEAVQEARTAALGSWEARRKRKAGQLVIAGGVLTGVGAGAALFALGSVVAADSPSSGDLRTWETVGALGGAGILGGVVCIHVGRKSR
jgi:hypothetical protein